MTVHWKTLTLILGLGTFASGAAANGPGNGNGNTPSTPWNDPNHPGAVNGKGPFSKGKDTSSEGGNSTTGLCPAQPPALDVGPDWDPAADAEYARQAADRLSRAVQIQTVSFDNMPNDPSAPVFDTRTQFAQFLEQEFPTVYAAAKHEMINGHSHLFTWGGGATPDNSTQGGNATVARRQNGNSTGSGGADKPIMLMAHLDVVPVANETAGDWTFEPFAGTVVEDATPDTPGIWIWGRGSSDNKDAVIALLAAMEKLISEGYTPPRPILIAMGFDEEVGGPRGAGKIAEVVLERYGPDGLAFVLDEGTSGLHDVYGSRVASVDVAEKGAVSFQLSLSTLGGHSSTPLPHTGIGYMARLLTYFEDHPFPKVLDEGSPFLKYLSCLGEHVPGTPADLKAQVQDSTQWPALAASLATDDRVANAYLTTTSAITLMNGGNKINALPESVNASIQHRIRFTSSIDETRQHYLDVLVPYAQQLNLSVNAFGQEYGLGPNASAAGTPGPSELTGGTGNPVPAGNLTIALTGRSMEPAPITSSEGASFNLVAGTIKTVWGNNTLVTPTGMVSNTDSAWMWNVTENIFRFTPAFLNETLNKHTVDERISLNALLSTIQFYYKLMRNLDGWSDEQN